MFDIILSKMMIVMATIDFNLTNMTRDGIFYVAFNPYTHVLGNLTWGVIMGFIGAGLYANERSIGTITTYMIVMGVFGSIVFPDQLVFLFGIIVAFLLSVIFYKTFIEVKQ